jgi:hypothetical protein
MATLTFDEGTNTTAFSTICALRMRVNMSAIGSLILILRFSYCLPACFDDTQGYHQRKPTHGSWREPGQLTERTAWTTGGTADCVASRIELRGNFAIPDGPDGAHRRYAKSLAIAQVQRVLASKLGDEFVALQFTLQ